MIRDFVRLRLRLWRAAGRALAAAPVKLAVLAIVWPGLLIGLYDSARRGMAFVNAEAGLGPFLLGRLWFLLLFVCFVLLIASHLAGAFSTMIRSPETRWWMTLPVSARALCRAKWLESSAYSAWAIWVLVAPLAIAYLVVLQRPIWLVGWAVVVLLPMMAIATALSTIALLAWLRIGGRLLWRRELVPFGLVGAAAALFWMLGERRQASEADAWFLALQELLPRMRVATAAWLPSSWAATALEAGWHGRWAQAGSYTALLWTSAALAWRALDHLAAVWFWPVLRAHAQAALAGPVTARGAGAGSAAAPLMTWRCSPLWAALAKDVLLVARDPVQWSQAVIFFGLLGAYFANLHRLAGFSAQPGWRIGIASLHLACTLLVLGSLAVRFVFPQMSLEGRRLWLLRVAPQGLRTVVDAKLLFYGLVGLVIVEGLLWLSASRLGIPSPVRWWLGWVGVAAPLSLVGLTLGCGAWWLDPDAQDAARIVSSSSGALTLVAVLLYVGGVVGALILGWTSWQTGAAGALLAASLWLGAISLLAGGWPMRRGWARLQRVDEI
jgi:ABC-2 type transport system permease protein